jgi:hypothetical protein
MATKKKASIKSQLVGGSGNDQRGSELSGGGGPKGGGKPKVKVAGTKGKKK